MKKFTRLYLENETLNLVHVATPTFNPLLHNVVKWSDTI